MDTITTINMLPVFNFLKDALAMLGFFTVIFASLFLLYSRKNIKQFVDKDRESKKLDTTVILALAQRYPDVEKKFIIKPEREQNIENNQEIHKLNQKFKALEDALRRDSLLHAFYFGGTDSDN